MNQTEYNEKVISTFGEAALRSVYVIDDQFPTYSDLIAGNKDSFSEWEIALRLHEFFREKKIPCDIENLAGVQVSDNQIDRIRKSDLIVLDYNLDSSDHNDSKTAIDILGRLADTSHFNMVVVYTKAPDLDKVWAEVAASMRGGWEDAKSTRHTEVYEKWVAGLDTPQPPAMPKPIRHAGIKDHYKNVPSATINAFRTELLNASTGEDGKPTLGMDDLTTLIEEVGRREIKQILKDHHEAELAKTRDITANCEGNLRWVQAGQCFITITGKPSDIDGHGTSPDHLVSCLHDALVDWKPSVLQLIIATIQNLLELNALATEAKSLSDPTIQVGLSYYLLWSLPHELNPDNPEELAPTVAAIVTKLVENLRQRVSGDHELNNSAARLLMHRLKEEKWFGEPSTQPVKRPRLFATAKAISNLPPAKIPSDENSLLLHLNAFLSAEPFAHDGVTTGTIFGEVGTQERWICLTPACDMVPRRPNEFQKWMYDIHPLRPATMVRLHEFGDPIKAAKNAEHGKFVFLSDKQNAVTAYSIVDETASQPVLETFFAQNAGRAINHVESGSIRFEAQRLKVNIGTKQTELIASSFEIFGQIRSTYASRFLHLVGQHTSRIGVDFVSIQKQ